MSQVPPPPPPQYPQPGYGATETYHAPSTGLAVAALVLGLISLPTNCVCIGPLVGLIAVALGIAALVRASNAPHLHGGRGMAIGGLATGGLSLVLALVLWISMAAFGVSLGQVIGQGMGVGRVAVDLEIVGDAIAAYQADHDAYPPDLELLAAEDLLSTNPVPGATGTPIEGTAYVTGLSPDDPADWILAYKHTEIMGFKLVGVLYNDLALAPARPSPDVTVTVGDNNATASNVEVLDQAQFTDEWVRFKQEYEAEHGEPPTVIEGPAGDTVPQ